MTPNSLYLPKFSFKTIKYETAIYKYICVAVGLKMGVCGLYNAQVEYEGRVL